MTAAHHIAAAERALATDQPNLAMLHMRRALEYVADEKAVSTRKLRAAHIKTRGIFAVLADDLHVTFVKPFRDLLAPWVGYVQSDFALVGPTKL